MLKLPLCCRLVGAVFTPNCSWRKENHVLNVKITEIFKRLILDGDIINPCLCLASVAIRSFLHRPIGWPRHSEYRGQSYPQRQFHGHRRCHNRRNPVFIGFGFENRELRIPPAQNDVCKVTESKCVKNVDESYPGFPVFPRHDCGEASRRQSRENRGLLIVRRSQTSRLNFAFLQ